MAGTSIPKAIKLENLHTLDLEGLTWNKKTTDQSTIFWFNRPFNVTMGFATVKRIRNDKWNQKKKTYDDFKFGDTQAHIEFKLRRPKDIVKFENDHQAFLKKLADRVAADEGMMAPSSEKLKKAFCAVSNGSVYFQTLLPLVGGKMDSNCLQWYQGKDPQGKPVIGSHENPLFHNQMLVSFTLQSDSRFETTWKPVLSHIKTPAGLNVYLVSLVVKGVMFDVANFKLMTALNVATPVNWDCPEVEMDCLNNNGSTGDNVEAGFGDELANILTDVETHKTFSMSAGVLKKLPKVFEDGEDSPPRTKKAKTDGEASKPKKGKKSKKVKVVEDEDEETETKESSPVMKSLRKRVKVDSQQLYVDSDEDLDDLDLDDE